MAKSRTSKALFAEFKRECDRIIKRLGLSGWDVRYEYKPRSKGDEAACCPAIGGRIVTFTFHRLADGYRVKTLAAHEIAHLVVAELAELATRRYTTEAELKRAEETTCTVLEKVLCGSS